MVSRKLDEHPKSWSNLFRALATTLVLFAGLTSCSQAGTETSTVESSTPPEFAITDFAGSFILTQLIVNNQQQPLVETFSVEISTVETSLALISSCNRKLGSYSFFADGRASITITGGTSKSCSSEVAQQEQTVVDALSEVTAWEPGTNNNEVALITQPSGSPATAVKPQRVVLTRTV